MVFWTDFYLNSSQKENELIFSIESKEVPTRLEIGDIKRLKSHVEKLEKAHLARVTLQGSSYSFSGKKDFLWKSTKFQLNSGTRKFMVNACIDI